MRLGSNLIMTRLLVPEMFGVMAVANVLILGLQLCSYFGIHHNIIQSHRGDEPVFLNTAWTFQIIRGFVIFLLAICLAGGLFLANVFGLVGENSAYHNPMLPIVLATLSITAIISGFESTKTTTANRAMKFDQVTKLELASQAAGLVVMIAWALFYKSIWALVAGTIIGTLAKTLLSHWYIKGPGNHIMWDGEIFKELFHFGKWMLLTTILGYLVSSGDRLVFAGLISAEVLGIYSIALFITTAMQDILTKLITNVTLPVLSKVVRERRDDLCRVYYKIRFPIDLGVLFVCGLLFSAGHVIIDALYDQRYSSAGHMLEILVISLFGARYIVSDQVYIALGKPKLLIPVRILQMMAIFVVIPMVYGTFGINGAIWTIGLTPLLVLPVTIYFMAKYGFLDIKKELYVMPALVFGLVVGELVSYMARQLF